MWCNCCVNTLELHCNTTKNIISRHDIFAVDYLFNCKSVRYTIICDSNDIRPTFNDNLYYKKKLEQYLITMMSYKNQFPQLIDQKFLASTNRLCMSNSPILQCSLSMSQSLSRIKQKKYHGQTHLSNICLLLLHIPCLCEFSAYYVKWPCKQRHKKTRFFEIFCKIL